MRKVEMYEHQGTHIDAPLHFANGGQDLTQIPPERLYGPGVVIDVIEKAAVNRDYAVTVDDLKGKLVQIYPIEIVSDNHEKRCAYKVAVTLHRRLLKKERNLILKVRVMMSINIA